MSDLLKTGSDWLQDQLKSHVSRSVVYKRGSEQVTLSATLGKTLQEQQDDEGFLSRFGSRDFIFQAEDLDFGSGAVEPESGDTITDGTAVYQLLADGGEPLWRYSDPYRKSIRVHAKQVE